MNVRLIQIDGALPNLALMRLAHKFRADGDFVTLTRNVLPNLFEPQYDRVYVSALFKFSIPKVEMARQQWPDAIVGGTHLCTIDENGRTQYKGPWVEDVIGEYRHLDFSDYPDFKESIGYTSRGCRLKCKFCSVPGMEGPVRSVATIRQLWRAGGPKKVHLLDNDFFGQTQWRERVTELREGKFRVCLSQGINIRMITEESATALATIEYRDTHFNERVLYTAWDNLGDEGIFFKGVDLLEAAGVPPKHLRVYMLIGFDPKETWERIWHRFNRMVERGIEPYPMVYDRSRKDLLCFQRWVITGLYRIVKWNEYERNTKSTESVEGFVSESLSSREGLGIYAQQGVSK